MKLIIGLGNTGDRYKETPHNAGFAFVDELRKKLLSKGITCTDWELKKSDESEISEIFDESGKKIAILAKPQTLMNLSGRAAMKLKKTYNIKDSSDIIVVYDELDIRLGSYKFSPSKNSRTHKGINSIISSIGYGFNSLRIGCDNRINREVMGIDYVLKRYTKKELEMLNWAIHTSLNESILKEIIVS